jgi:hypothetical protein
VRGNEDASKAADAAAILCLVRYFDDVGHVLFAARVDLNVQATAWPHWPVALHGCTPLPEQLVCPGPQTPVQLAVAPDWTQVLLALHVESMLELRPLAAHFLTS